MYKKNKTNTKFTILKFLLGYIQSLSTQKKSIGQNKLQDAYIILKQTSGPLKNDQS